MLTSGQKGRIGCWGAAGGVLLVSLTISIGHWRDVIELPEDMLTWLVFAMIVLWEAGYWVGQPKPQVVQVADLNAVRKAIESIPALVRDEVERAVKREIANAYVDTIANGGPGLRVVRDSGDRSH